MPRTLTQKHLYRLQKGPNYIALKIVILATLSGVAGLHNTASSHWPCQMNYLKACINSNNQAYG